MSISNQQTNPPHEDGASKNGARRPIKTIGKPLSLFEIYPSFIETSTTTDSDWPYFDSYYTIIPESVPRWLDDQIYEKSSFDTRFQIKSYLREDVAKIVPAIWSRNSPVE